MDATAAPALQGPGAALVIGAGLSGAACAYSLARRGWRVAVLERGAAPAAGASGLPVGLVVPHTSADDTRISQISRIGIRHMLAHAAALLQAGEDWAATGVLEHCVEGRIKLPPQWADAAAAAHDAAIQQFWSHPASASQIAQGGLPAGAAAIWHGCAAWIKPPALVAAMLRQPGVVFQANAAVAALRRTEVAGQPPQASHWQALDAHGAVLAEADMAVLAAGFDSAALMSGLQLMGTGKPQAEPLLHLPLNPLRGQVAWGWMDAGDVGQPGVPADPANPANPANPARDGAAVSASPQSTNARPAWPASANLCMAEERLPPFPVNGKGSMAAHIPYRHGPRQGRIWITGSTFQRGETDAAARVADLPAILDKLRTLHPAAAQTLQAAFDSGQAHGWAGVRATLPDRLPAIGAWPGAPGLHLCCGMGARGLTLAALGGELLAARLHDEPLPLAPHLAGMLDAARWLRKGQRRRAEVAAPA